MENEANDPEVEYLRKRIADWAESIKDKAELKKGLASLENNNAQADWEEFDEEDMKAFAESEEDEKAGRVVDAFEHLALLKAKYLGK